MSKISIIVPTYNEAQNLPVFYERLCAVMQRMEIDWEVIIVDDHSSDQTFTRVSELGKADPRVRGIRMSRNCGSHTAIVCGLEHAEGDCAMALAADLQDPPETIPALLAEWRKGAQVVWAVRGRREGEKASALLFARLYYFLMRRFVGLREMPATGADFFLIDRCVMNALLQYRERNISLMALIMWLGFRQRAITYTKEARLHGVSGWTLHKKLKLVVDSVTSFSYTPIRTMSLLGVLFALGGFVFAAVVVICRLAGWVVAGTGYAALMTALLVGFGLIMLMLGIIGEYLWRTFDEARGRPRYIVEDRYPPGQPRPDAENRSDQEQEGTGQGDA